MAWSEAARRAAALARKRKSKGYKSDRRIFDKDPPRVRTVLPPMNNRTENIRDNDGRLHRVRIHQYREDMLRGVANAKNYIRGRTSSGGWKSKGAASRYLRKTRRELYGADIMKRKL